METSSRQWRPGGHVLQRGLGTEGSQSPAQEPRSVGGFYQRVRRDRERDKDRTKDGTWENSL